MEEEDGVGNGSRVIRTPCWKTFRFERILEEKGRLFYGPRVMADLRHLNQSIVGKR